MTDNSPSYDAVLHTIRILVAEDDRVMTRLLRDMLGAMGFTNVETVTNGEKALEYLQYNDVDILICDWLMYPMDGLTLTNRVREKLNNSNRFVPIVMLTGKGDKQDVITARDAGVTEYVVKPFTARALYKRIKIVIENPRGFVLSKQYKGPDRRRKRALPPDGSKKRKSDQHFMT